ncbi:MAG: hypothetical protein R3F19_23675 [Verrucomicrobiales bacterium]
MRKTLIIDLLGRVRESAAGIEAKIEQLTAQVEQPEMLTQETKRIRQLERENQTLVCRHGPEEDRPGEAQSYCSMALLPLSIRAKRQATKMETATRAMRAMRPQTPSQRKEKRRRSRRSQLVASSCPRPLSAASRKSDLPEDEKIDAETGLTMIFLG